MSERSTWDKVKSKRPSTGARQRGYADATDAIVLGARVRSERERQGLTQTKPAVRMETTQPAVARLESGGVMPSLDTLRRAADALGLELIVDFREAAQG